MALLHIATGCFAGKIVFSGGGEDLFCLLFFILSVINCYLSILNKFIKKFLPGCIAPMV
jgi:hypothetical protein